MTPHAYFMGKLAMGLPIQWGHKQTAFDKFLADSPTSKRIFNDLRPVWTIQEYRKGYRVGAISPN